jgi:hypothetical protein
LRSTLTAVRIESLQNASANTCGGKSDERLMIESLRAALQPNSGRLPKGDGWPKSRLSEACRP